MLNNICETTVWFKTDAYKDDKACCCPRNYATHEQEPLHLPFFL